MPGSADPKQPADSPPPAKPRAGRRRRPGDPAAIHNQAARFTRVRKDHAGETGEDYVELIAQLIREHGEARTVDIARRLGVSHVTVTKTVARLQRAGLVRTQPYRSITLTEPGEKLAERVAGRHALVVRFLRKLGVAAADAETDAEGLEHHLSPSTLEAIERFVQDPQ